MTLWESGATYWTTCMVNKWKEHSHLFSIFEPPQYTLFAAQFFSAWCRCMLAVRRFRYIVYNSLSHHFNPQPQGLFKTYLFYCLERMFSKCDYLCKLRKDFNKFQIFCSTLQKKTILFQLLFVCFFFLWGGRGVICPLAPPLSSDQFFAEKKIEAKRLPSEFLHDIFGLLKELCCWP